MSEGASNSAAFSSSLQGSVPNGTVQIELCAQSTGKCSNTITQNGLYGFNNIAASSNEHFTLTLRQENKVPVHQSINLHADQNFFNLSAFNELTHLSYEISSTQDIYIGINALNEPYIANQIEVGSQYAYKLSFAQLSASITKLNVEIGEDTSFNALHTSNGTALSTQRLYLKIFDQDMQPVTLQQNSSTNNAPRLASSYLGECQGNSYFFLNATEDALLKDEAGDYIDINANEPGIQLEVYGYNTSTHTWENVGQGDYDPASKEVKTCGDFDAASVSVVFPVVNKQPQTLCVEASYQLSNGTSSPAEGVLIKAEGNLFQSAHTNAEGKVTLELWEDGNLYTYRYSDAKHGVENILFSPSTAQSCTYEANIAIASQVNAKVHIKVNDINGSAFEGEFVHLYEKDGNGVQHAFSDSQGNISFDAQIGKHYRLISQSFEKEITVTDAALDVSFMHQNISPALFIYTNASKTELFVIGYDSDSDTLLSEVIVDDVVITPIHTEILGESSLWTYVIDPQAQLAKVKVSDASHYTKENYYLDFEGDINHDLILTFIDPNGERIQPQFIYAEVPYQIDLLDNEEALSTEYLLDDVLLASNQITLSDVAVHRIKIKSTFINGILEKEWSITAQAVYQAPEIVTGLYDRVVNYLLSESFEINAKDNMQETLQYNWKINGQSVNALPTMQYTFDTLGNQNISVEVSNRYKTVTSNAVLNVAYAQPVILDDLNSTTQDILAGSDDDKQQQFQIVAEDPYKGVLTYKWFVNDTIVSLEKTFNYTFDKLGTYDIYCEVSNQYQTTTSGVKRINYFYDAPIIESTNLRNWLKINYLLDNRLYVDAKDPYNQSLTYQWFINGNLVSEKNEITITPQSMRSYRITLKVSNQYNSKTISTYAYAYPAAPVIITPKNYQRIPAIINETKELSADATDPYGGELRYQWYTGRDGFIGEGKTINHTFTSTYWNYVYCVVSNAYTSVQVFAYVDVNYQEPLVLKELQGYDDAIYGLEYPFDVNASDPYGTALSYTWYVNNSYVKTGSQELIRAFNKEGPNQVKVIIKNGYNRTAQSVSDVNVTIPSPTIISGLSNHNTHMGVTESFEVLAEDFYNAPTYEWYLNNKIVGRSNKLNYIFTQAGDNNLTCRVRNKYGKFTDTSAVMNVIDYNPPVINSTNLENMTLHRGESFTFNADVTNPESDSLTYRWYVDGKLQESNSSTFNHEFVLEGTQKVKLEVLNTYKSVSREINVMTIYDAPILNNTLNDLSVKVGQEYSFNVNATNPESGELHYEWYVNGIAVDETTSTLRGIYEAPAELTVKCKVSNRYKSVTTNTASLSVTYESPVIGTPLVDQNIKRGDTVNFNVQANNPENDALQYAWYINNIKVSSSETFSYTFSKNESFTLKCVVSNRYQSTETSATIESFYGAPVLLSSTLSSHSLKTGDSVDFDVSASDPQNDPLIYEWFVNGQKVSEGTSYTYEAQNNGLYTVWCKVSNLFESVSTKGSITVSDENTQPIEITTLPYAHVVVYENNMSINTSVQVGDDGIVFLPVSGEKINIGVVFGPETVLDEATFHKFFAETEVLPRYNNNYNYKGCPDVEHIYWTSKYYVGQSSYSYSGYDPYFTGEEFFTADENGNLNFRIERDELFNAALTKFDTNANEKLELGELPSHKGTLKYITQIYQNATVRSYTFKELVSQNDIREVDDIIGTIDLEGKCKTDEKVDMGFHLDPYRSLNHEFTDLVETGLSTSLFSLDQGLLSLSIIFDQTHEGVLIKESNATNYDINNSTILTTEEVTLNNLAPLDSWKDTTVHYLYATSSIGNAELITSNLDYYQNESKTYLLSELDAGKRFLSYQLWRYDSLSPMLNDPSLYEYEIYSTHNFVEVPASSNEMNSYDEPEVIINRNQDTMTVSASTLQSSDIIEHTFSHESDSGSLFIKIRNFEPEETINNFINSSDTQHSSVKTLIPDDLFNPEIFSNDPIELDITYVSHSGQYIQFSGSSEFLKEYSTIQLVDNNTSEIHEFTIYWFTTSEKTQAYVSGSISGNYEGSKVSIVQQTNEIETVEVIDIKEGNKNEIIDTLQNGKRFESLGAKRTKKIITDEEFIHPWHVGE